MAAKFADREDRSFALVQHQRSDVPPGRFLGCHHETKIGRRGATDVTTMPRRSASGNKALRRQAEVAAENWLFEKMGCLHVRRAVRMKRQKVDFWGCDLVGKRAS